MGNSNSRRYEVELHSRRQRFTRSKTIRNNTIDDDGGNTIPNTYYNDLQTAITQNDSKEVYDLLHKLNDVNEKVKLESTYVLYAACTCGNPEISSLVANKSSCFDFTEQCVETNSYPIHEAARKHDTMFFKILSHDPNFKQKYASKLSMVDNEGNTLLHIAANEQEVDIVAFSLEFGLDPLKGNYKGVTPLHFAAMQGSEIIAQILLESERVTDVKAYIATEAAGVCRETPFYFSAKFNHPNMIEFLLNRYSEAGGNEQDLIEHTTMLGFTPLLSAVRFTNPKCVTVLLEKGANILAKDQKRSLNALHWAVAVQSPSIIKEILSYVKASLSNIDSKRVWTETDPHGNTAHHLAAETSNMAVLETLVSVNKSGLEIKNKGGYTPLHTGARIGKQEIVNFIISAAPGTTYLSDNNGNSVLHIAAEMGHEDLVECLMDTHNFGLIVCSRNTSNGKTPLHLAAQNGHYSVLAFLLQHQQTPDTAIEITDHRSSTALYLACKEGHAKCVEVLLRGGAKVTYSTHDHSSIKSCLGVAISKQNRAVVSVILQSPSWKHALRVSYCPPHIIKCDRHTLERNASTIDEEQVNLKKCNTTPFRELIKTMPDLAMVVLDKCRKEYDNGEREYNYEFIEDFVDLFIEEECPNFDVSRPVNERHHRPLSQTVSQSRIAAESTDHHQPTAQPCENKPWGPEEYYYWNHPLQLMVEHRREQLLSHPVVKTFIRRKWYRLGACIFYFNVLMYATLMSLLTAYMYLHFDLTMSLQRNMTRLDATSILSNCSLEITTISHHDEVRRHLMIAIASLIVIICLMRIIVELFQLAFYSGEYLTSWINLIEGFLYIGTIIFVLSDFNYTCLNSWRWQLGALCIFLSWINFVLFMSKEPTFGIYVVMFQEVLKTFLKTIPMSTLLIFAFGQPFYMLLSPVIVESEPSTMPFHNLGYSLLKTVTMTIGEFDEVDHILFRVPNVIEYQFSTYLLWLIFVVVMAILLQNMLVGLAVDNIKGVLEQAALEKEALQIEFLLKLTNIKCFRYLTRKFNSSHGQRKTWRGWKWCRTQMITLSFFSGRDYDIQHHRCLRSRTYSPSKDTIEVMMQNHFQKVNDRCDRLEKLILKQITEQKCMKQSRRIDLGIRSRTLSILSVADDAPPDQGFLNQFYHEPSPIETESEA